jgi:membrane-associated phospholipid phosphatase
MRWHIPATRFDRHVAAAIEQHASPELERPAKVATVLADERALLVLVAGIWLISRAGTVQRRREGNHLVANVAVVNVLSRTLKRVFAQERPDRTMVHGRRQGIPKSGEASSAFPSGHAMYVGAVSSALARFFPSAAPLIWAAGSVVAATRVLLLAHWASDVAVGAASGIGIERLLWSLGRSLRRHGARPPRS